MDLRGHYRLRLRRGGELVYRHRTKNLVVTSGETLAVQRFNFSGAVAAPQWIAFGTDATTAVKSQLALIAEIAGSRFAAVSALSLGTVLRLGFSIAVPATWTNVSEVGIFNAAAAGTMVSRSVIPPFSAVLGDSLTIFWFLEFLGSE